MQHLQQQICVSNLYISILHKCDAKNYSISVLERRRSVYSASMQTFSKIHGYYEWTLVLITQTQTTDACYFQNVISGLQHCKWACNIILKTLPSKIQTLLSRLHVARYAPLVDHATLLTSFSCPSNVAIHSKSADLLLQIDVVPSKLVAARSLPQGDQFTQRIVRWWAPSSIVLQTQRFSPKQSNDNIYQHKQIWFVCMFFFFSESCKSF